jgi:hypothetical protein
MSEAPTMRLPRVRFTVWQLMVAVAVVAMLLFSGIMLRRRSDFLKKAEDCQSWYEYHLHTWREFSDAADWNRDRLDRLMKGKFSDHRDLDPERYLGSDLSLPELIDKMRRRCEGDEEYVAGEAKSVSHFARLRAKYRKAAARPWTLVEPDPPAPPNPVVLYRASGVL